MDSESLKEISLESLKYLIPAPYPHLGPSIIQEFFDDKLNKFENTTLTSHQDLERAFRQFRKGPSGHALFTWVQKNAMAHFLSVDYGNVVVAMNELWNLLEAKQRKAWFQAADEAKAIYKMVYDYREEFVDEPVEDRRKMFLKRIKEAKLTAEAYTNRLVLLRLQEFGHLEMEEWLRMSKY